MPVVRSFTLFALAALCAGCNPPPAEKVNRISYRGEKFEIIKPESNFDVSDDRVYARPEDGERIEQLMREATIGTSFANLPDLLAAVEPMQFPGYPRSILPEQRSSDPKDKTHILLIGLEIPRRYKDRFLTFRSREDGGYDLVDDFVTEPKPPKPAPPAPAPLPLAEGEEPPPPPPPPEPERVVIAQVKWQGSKLTYLDPTGATVRTK